MARLVADEDKENHKNLPVERQSKCAKLSFSLPKDRFSFFVDDKDLEEAMKTYVVGKNTALKIVTVPCQCLNSFDMYHSALFVSSNICYLSGPTRGVYTRYSEVMTFAYVISCMKTELQPH